MPVSLTINGIPDPTRDVLAARAARVGQSLEEYVRKQLTALARRPAEDDFWGRVQERVTMSATRLAADAIIEARDAERT